MDNKKRLLLVGGGYADIPLIAAAQSLGFFVITSGNNPDDRGHALSDLYCPADFSDPAAILDIAKKQCIDAVCPCANDFSALSAAYVAEKLGLPGHDSYSVCQTIHHKDSYRSFAIRNGVPTPKAIGAMNIDFAMQQAEALALPIIVKPVDLTGGKGITRVDHRSDVKQALFSAFSISRNNRVVVEEYLSGSKHGFSALIKNGKVVFHFLDDEHYHLNPYMVSGASTPASVSVATADRLVQQAEHIAQKLSLADGIFHVQYILHNQQPVIIEICRRPPGDLYITLVQLATGFDYPSSLVRLFSGMDSSDITQHETRGYYLRHCIMANHNGTLADIYFSPDIQDKIVHKYMWGKPGQKIDNYLTQKFGIVFLKFNNKQEMDRYNNEITDKIQVRVR